jgi:hypothetical protein
LNLVTNQVMSFEKSPHERWNEDLLAQARRGLAIGHALCTCEGYYHLLWGSLRAAGVSNSLRAEEPLLASLIAPQIREDARVMIGGSADPGLLCALGRIYAPRRPAITIAERCRAPLELIREFTAAKGLSCRTLNCDLLDLDGGEQWDQVVLHYTSEFVETHLRNRLFRCIEQSLAPGGTLVCAAMTATRVVGDDRQELAAIYFDYSLRALKNSPLADLAGTPEFPRMLQAYSARWGLQRANLPTSEELRMSLHAAGLRIVSENTLPRPKRFVGDAAIVDSCSIIVAGR